MVVHLCYSLNRGDMHCKRFTIVTYIKYYALMASLTNKHDSLLDMNFHSDKSVDYSFHNPVFKPSTWNVYNNVITIPTIL